MFRITVVTSRLSRAIVHHACRVYMALPSASKATTRRPGEATAAPTATGRPWPMAPPVKQSQSWGGAPAVEPTANRPEVFPSSDTIAPSGSRIPSASHTAVEVRGPVGRAGVWASCRGAAPRQEAHTPARPTGPLTSTAVCEALGILLPEGAIVSDEGNTSGLFAVGSTAGAPPHDWLCLTGGAIGQGLPVAVGAAVASPGRRVVALEADGSAMYTLQAWWTMARESLDVTTVILNNHSYAVLNMELDRVGAESPGPRARDMLDLRRPDIDFVHLAAGMGLHAARAETAEEFTDELARALATPGPSVVEAVIPSLL